MRCHVMQTEEVLTTEPCACDHVMLCCVVLCCVVLGYVMLCYVMLCYVMLSDVGETVQGIGNVFG